tara:strand:- start:164 stop:337 length:174 start_codon:yes stop_codon:yes gene_type:complete
MITSIIIFVLGFFAGILVARNNIKKVNAIVTEVQDAAADLDKKIEDLPAKWKKHLGK